MAGSQAEWDGLCDCTLRAAAEPAASGDVWQNLTFKTGGVDANACGRILELIQSGALDLTPLLTHRFPLERAMEAYALFEAKAEGVLKIALEPPQIQ